MKGTPMRRRVLSLGVATLAVVTLAGCSVSITANPDSSDDVATAEASVSATPDASDAAFIDQQTYDFCVLEAKGALELIGVLGDAADQAITDGIAASISSQQMDAAQGETCKKAWLATLAENGITYHDPDGGGAASPAASSSAG
jgi:hypothetical protein